MKKKKSLLLGVFIFLLSSCDIFRNSSLSNDSQFPSESNITSNQSEQPSITSSVEPSDSMEPSIEPSLEPSILPNVSESISSTITSVDLNYEFSSKRYVPEIIKNNTTNLPKFFGNTSFKLTYTLKHGQPFVGLAKSNDRYFIKKESQVGSGVIEIEVTLEEFPGYYYTYESVVNPQFYSGLPVVNIETEDSTVHYNEMSKEEYTSSYISVVEPVDSETIKVELSNQLAGVRLRGNSTIAAPKKAFRIKFDKKQSLFGLEKAKSWVLLANYYDKSNLRNYLAYSFAQDLARDGYLGFQPSSIMVEVNYNGEYIGLYLLCEQMQSGVGRVDIEDNVDPITGETSYFLEMDERAVDEFGDEGKNVFYITLENYRVSSSPRHFAFKFPDPDDAALTVQQIEYINNYLMKVDQAIYSASGYEDLIDVESFIDYYIVQELFKNVDVASTSQYYVKEIDGKLKMGPVWDFDISLGVIGTQPGDGTYSSYENQDRYVRYRDPWFNLLFQDQAFSDKVKVRYTQIREKAIIDLYERFLEVTQDDIMIKAQNKNVQKWKLDYNSEESYGTVSLWIERYYNQNYRSLSTLEEHYEYLKTNFIKRVEIMDNAYLLG